MLKFSAPLLGFFLWAAAVPAQALDAAGNATLKKARQLQRQGRPVEAYHLLQERFGEAAGDAEIQYALGEAALAAGDTPRARQHYENVLKTLPESSSTLYRLGHIYYAAGEKEKARDAFERAAQARDADYAARNYLRGLARFINAQLPPNRRGPEHQVDLFVGLTHDSNVNVAPAGDSVAAIIGGLPTNVLLAPEAQEVRGTGLQESINGQYLKTLSRDWSVLLQGGLANIAYVGKDEYDNQSLAAGIGFLYSRDRWRANLQPNMRWIVLDGSTDSRLAGLNLRLGHVGDASEVYAIGGINSRRLPADGRQDSRQSWLGAGYVRLIKPGLRAGVELAGLHNRADSGIFSGNSLIPQVYADWQPDDLWSLGLALLYQRQSFDEQDPLFPVLRRDRRTDFNFSFSRNLDKTLNGLSLQGNFTRTDNHSTVGLYDYRRNVATVGVNFRF